MNTGKPIDNHLRLGLSEEWCSDFKEKIPAIEKRLLKEIREAAAKVVEGQCKAVYEDFTGVYPYKTFATATTDVLQAQELFRTFLDEIKKEVKGKNVALRTAPDITYSFQKHCPENVIQVRCRLVTVEPRNRSKG